MKKLLLFLVLFGLLFAAYNTAPATNIKNAICDLQNSVKSLLLVGIMISVILALPFLALGGWLFISNKDKTDKNLWKYGGLAIAILSVLGPVLLAAAYILTPLLINSITGSDVATSC